MSRRAVSPSRRGATGDHAGFAWLYDLVMGLAERGPLSRWRRSIVRPLRGCVLEVGAGTGLDFPYYDAGVTVVATDVEPAMLSRARARASAAKAAVLLVVADAQVLPFRNATFDGAVVGLALCTIRHPDITLAELHRTVRSAGTVSLLEHVRVPNDLVGRFQDWVTPVWRRLAGGCHLNRDTLGAVKRSGLEVERVVTHAGGWVLEILARPSPARARSTCESASVVYAEPDNEACAASLGSCPDSPDRRS
jgi:ubiquinone/menaquinone biosynthesis C-methylase UbiE